YEFDIEYIEGKRNYADIFSRNQKVEINRIESKGGEKIIPETSDELIILQQYHNLTGHGGRAAMIYLIKDRYYINNLTEKVANFIECCEICQLAHKNKKTKEISPIK
ncbi:hypothetical protein COBT_003605, partial [Conglomerata obtusa]